MAEREGIDKKALLESFLKVASSLEGFSFTVPTTDQMRLALTGEGSFTLWLSPKAAGEPAPSGVPIGAEASPPAERDRVSVTGRLSREPRYVMQGSVLRVGFQVAEHDEEGATTFHDCYARKTYAERIRRKAPRLGDEVRIEGERQKRIGIRKGKEQEIEEIFCYGLTVITRPQRNASR